jgi:hypothetical protein
MLVPSSTMNTARVAAFAVSPDGFGARPRLDINNPLGVRAFELHTWFQGTEALRKMHGQSGGTQGIDNTEIDELSHCSSTYGLVTLVGQHLI